MWRWLASVCALVALSASATDEAPQVRVDRDGATYSVRASVNIAADLPIAWNTLTDYERLPEFISDIRRSRVLAREGNRLTVAMSGGLRILFLEWPVRVRLAVRHEPYGRVLASSDPGTIDGEPPTVREFSGSYVLTASPIAGGAGVRLDYDARFELAEALPPLIGPLFGPLFGRALVRVAISRQFEALVAEIERRQHAAPAIRWSTS